MLTSSRELEMASWAAFSTLQGRMAVGKHHIPEHLDTHITTSYGHKQ
jgi:hypothetical protein